MVGIIFNNLNDFNEWNDLITRMMHYNQQIMDNWATPIISLDGSNQYFGITQSEGIRRTVIEQYMGDNVEVEISQTDPKWFVQHTMDGLH